ncbi:hypothetical protein LOTGIDRAFT_106674, partial [Lottia gigantea]
CATTRAIFLLLMCDHQSYLSAPNVLPSELSSCPYCATTRAILLPVMCYYQSYL